ncbi:MAG: hypothetical protein A2Z16_03325 [Chloroflexi bacterium RBG_16_54_18]|nr:MAG: hypothetical protein A2Z16_03325 [Chloroflexi bacterium RBG_16_54_18]
MRSKTFSVVIPTRDRPAALEICLNSILAQDFSASDFEIIVINDGGCALNLDKGKFLQSKVPVLLIEQPNQGPAAARNTAVKHSNACNLAFTDDDCLVDRSWLKQLYCALQKDPNAIAGGRTLSGIPKNSYSLANQLLVEFLYYYYHLTPGEKSQPPFFASNNMALKREVFQVVGGFDVRLRSAEDRDFCERLRQAGSSSIYAQSALVYHFHRMNLAQFLKLHHSYGGGNYFFHLYRRVRGWGNYRLEPINFYTGMLRYPFRSEKVWRAAWLSLLLGLSQASNLSGFTTQAVKELFRK